MGVGSHMKQLFSLFLINARPDCPCHQHAAEYDDWGPDECERQIPLIIDRLKTESTNRKLPFVRIVAERLVRYCIKLARRDLRREVHPSGR